MSDQTLRSPVWGMVGSSGFRRSRTATALPGDLALVWSGSGQQDEHDGLCPGAWKRRVAWPQRGAQFGVGDHVHVSGDEAQRAGYAAQARLNRTHST